MPTDLSAKLDTNLDLDNDYPPQKINLSEALKFRYQNKLSYAEIAKHYGVTPQAVHDRIKRFKALLLDSDEAETFREKEVEIIRNVRFNLIEAMLEPNKIKEASINNLAYAQSQLFRDESILSGRPTDIYNSLQINADLADIEKRKAELLKQIGIVDVKSGEDPPKKGDEVGND